MAEKRRRGDDAFQGISALFSSLLANLRAESDRWPLWFPVGLGAGIALYFALPSEPSPVLGITGLVFACAVLAVAGYKLRKRGPVRGVGTVFGVALILVSVLGGLVLAQGHSAHVAAPVLERPLGRVEITGRVATIEPGLKGTRLTLENPVIARLDAEKTPGKIRVRLRSKGDLSLVSGDRVRLFAVLMPPPGPAAPGAFDFARIAWFKGIGAVGYGVSRPELVAGGTARDGHDAVAGLRNRLYAKITAGLEGASGGVAAALMTGERGHIPEATMEDMRAAGLAHLLAISGLHIGLVTGILFFALRALLALFPVLALRFPIKKWAAGAALLGGGAYMILTGATVPTQRAFLMTALVLAAVMVDRAAISMRLVAWAAVIVLALAPESLMGPSFQMSFAAVIALIAVYEGARAPLVRWHGHGGWSRRLLIYGAGVLLTTLVAGLATAPFALYHFNRFATFGLLANLGAVPVTAFWIMPFALLSYILAPLGLEQYALTPMGWGIDGMLAIAHFVAHRPGASLWVTAMPAWGLGFAAIGGLWLCLWRGRWRMAGLAVIVAGLLSLAIHRPPDILVAGNGQSFAVYDNDGTLLFAGARGSKFQREIWLRRSGNGARLALAKMKKRLPLAPNGALACDALGCMVRIRGQRVSFLNTPLAAAEDCARADVVISLQPLGRTWCEGPRRIIDRFDLWREGAHALWIAGDGKVRVRTVAGARGDRPWSGAGRGR